MEKVYKTNGLMRVLTAVFILWALLWIGLFMNACIHPNPVRVNRIFSFCFFGLLMLLFLLIAIYFILLLNDKVVLTDDSIRFHLLKFPYSFSLRFIDDEVAWKEIRDVSFVEKSNAVLLVLKLFSGEVKEFWIDHLENRLRLDIESRFNPDVHFEEEEEWDSSRPGTLEWSKKRSFRKLLISALGEIIGIALMALGHRWGIILVFPALIFGFVSLYSYYSYNSLLSNPVLARKGRITMILGAFLLIALCVVACII